MLPKQLLTLFALLQFLSIMHSAAAVEKQDCYRLGGQCFNLCLTIHKLDTNCIISCCNVTIHYNEQNQLSIN
ncbi:hypothetical protein FQR65_LT02242 [Abscondita terminalis]|nr:hypothetical protein FQR65_LT02242 [Abscondita terminalis]